MTDNEREYDSEMAVMLSHLIDDEPMWSCVVIAKKLHAAGFRRTEVPEPLDRSDPRQRKQALVAQRAEAALGRRPLPEQGEPSDAEVSAALLGYFPEVKDQKELQKWGKRTRERMRAALRAAYEARGEGR